LRRLALATFLVGLLVAGVLLARAADRDTGVVAFTNDAAAGDDVLSIAPSRTGCQHVASVPYAFDGVHLTVSARDAGQSLRVSVVDPGSRRTLASAPAETAAGRATLGPAFAEVQAGRPVDVCVRNEGARRIAVVGSPGAEASDREGVEKTGEVALIFIRAPRSLLDRIPDAFDHAALFKPDWTGPWTFWLLAGGVLLVVPGLVGGALWTAVREDPTATGPEGRPVSYESFRERVEPRLLEPPRVHRFAEPPLLGEPGAEGLPVAVCVEPADGAGPQRTLASLDRQTRAPAEVIEGPPAEALARTTAPLVAVVRAGDELAPIALERLGQAGRLVGDAVVITCDEDILNGAGERHHPRLRPGPSPDHLLAQDLTGSLVCLRRGAAPRELDGHWRHRAALLQGGPDGVGLAHVPAILCHRRPGPRPEVNLGVLAEALDARGEPSARLERVADGVRVRRPVAGEPSVEAIVLFRDRPELLRRCTDSMLRRTSWDNLRIRLVDNGSTNSEVAELLGRLERDPRVTVMRDERNFNFAALNNAAVAASGADYVVFLNNDTEVVDGDWIEALLEEAQRPDVGAVAPLLTYPDGSVQHAGAALGMHEYAGHPFAGLDPAARTPFGSALDGTRNWLAVTAACMLVERRKLDAAGGFDESFVVAGNDVELCLRLTAAGHRSLCVPHVRLVHDESRSRGSHIDPADFERSRASYGAFRTIGDPFYNPGLTLRRTDCGLRGPEEL
jgi:GT2 family glycosyltransferase